MKNLIIRSLRLDEEIAFEGMKGFLHSDAKLRAFLKDAQIGFMETTTDIIIGK